MSWNQYLKIVFIYFALNKNKYLIYLINDGVITTTTTTTNKIIIYLYFIIFLRFYKFNLIYAFE
jgi:hypothetical protein